MFIKRQTGLTLIELIVFIVIVSVGLTGVLSSLNISVRGSADPLLPKQALAIAEGLLEEILLKSYCDPDGAGTIMTDTPPTCGTNTIESRGSRDCVDDFDTVVGDANETEIADDLQRTPWPTGYRAYVLVTLESPVIIGSTANPSKVVAVRVSYGNGAGSITLTGYKTNY